MSRSNHHYFLLLLLLVVCLGTRVSLASEAISIEEKASCSDTNILKFTTALTGVCYKVVNLNASAIEYYYDYAYSGNVVRQRTFSDSACVNGVIMPDTFFNNSGAITGYDVFQSTVNTCTDGVTVKVFPSTSDWITFPRTGYYFYEISPIASCPNFDTTNRQTYIYPGSCVRSDLMVKNSFSINNAGISAGVNCSTFSMPMTKVASTCSTTHISLKITTPVTDFNPVVSMSYALPAGSLSYLSVRVSSSMWDLISPKYQVALLDANNVTFGSCSFDVIPTIQPSCLVAYTTNMYPTRIWVRTLVRAFAASPAEIEMPVLSVTVLNETFTSSNFRFQVTSLPAVSTTTYLFNNQQFTCPNFPCTTPNLNPTASGAPFNLTVYSTLNGILSKPFYFIYNLAPTIVMNNILPVSISSNYLALKASFNGGNNYTASLKVYYQNTSMPTELLACDQPNGALNYICNFTVNPATYYRVRMVIDDNFSSSTFRKLFFSLSPSTYLDVISSSPSDIVLQALYPLTGTLPLTVTYLLGGLAQCTLVLFGAQCNMFALTLASSYNIQVSYLGAGGLLLGNSDTIPVRTQDWITPNVTLSSYNSITLTISYESLNILPVNYTVYVNDVAQCAQTSPLVSIVTCTSQVPYIGFHLVSLGSQSNRFSLNTTLSYFANFVPSISANWFKGYTLFTMTPSQNSQSLLKYALAFGTPTQFGNTNIFNLTTTLGQTYNYCGAITQINVPSAVSKSICNTFTPTALLASLVISSLSSSIAILSSASTGGSPFDPTKFYFSLNGSPTSCWGGSSPSCTISSLTANTSYTVLLSTYNNDQTTTNSIQFETSPKSFQVVPSIQIYATGFYVDAVTVPLLSTQLNPTVLLNGTVVCSILPCSIRGLVAQSAYTVKVIVYSVIDNTYQESVVPVTTALPLKASIGANEYNPTTQTFRVNVLSVSQGNPTSTKTYQYDFNGVGCGGAMISCDIPATPSLVIGGTVTISDTFDTVAIQLMVSTYVGLTVQLKYLALSKTIYFSAVPSQVVSEATPVFSITPSAPVQISNNPSFDYMIPTTQSTSYNIVAKYTYPPSAPNTIVFATDMKSITTFGSIYLPTINPIKLVSMTDQSMVVEYGVLGGAPSTTTLYSVKSNGADVSACQNTPSTQCTIPMIGIGFYIISIQASNEITLNYDNTQSPLNNIQLTTTISYVTSTSIQLKYTSNYVFSQYQALIGSSVYAQCQLDGVCVVSGLVRNTTYNNIVIQGTDSTTSYTLKSAPLTATTSYPFEMTKIFLIESTPTTATIAYGLADRGTLPVIYTILVNGIFIQNTTLPITTLNTLGQAINVMVTATYYEDQASSSRIINPPPQTIDGINLNLIKVDITSVTFNFTTNVPLYDVQYTVKLNGVVMPGCLIGSVCSASGLKEASTNTILVSGTYNNGQWAPIRQTTFTTFSKLKSVSIVNNITTDTINNFVIVNVDSVGGDPQNTQFTIYNGLTKLVPATSSRQISIPLVKLYPWYQLRVIANYSTSSVISPYLNYVALSFEMTTTVTSNSVQVSVTPSYLLDVGVWTPYIFVGNFGCTGLNCNIPNLNPSTDYLATFTATQSLGKISQSLGFKTNDIFQIAAINLLDYSVDWLQVGYPATGGNTQTPLTYSVLLNGQPRAECGSTQSFCNITGLTQGIEYTVKITATRVAQEVVTLSRIITLPSGADLTISVTSLTTSTATIVYPLRGVLTESIPITYSATLNGSALSCVGDSCQLTSLVPGQTYSFGVTAKYLNDKFISSQTVFTTYPAINAPQISIVQLTTTVIIVNITVAGGVPTSQTIQQLLINGINPTQQCTSGLCVFSGLVPATTYIFKAIATNDAITKETTVAVTTYPIISIANFEPYQRNATGIYVDLTTNGGVPGQSIWTVTVDSTVLCSSANSGSPSACYLPITNLSTYQFRLDLSNDGTSLNREVLFRAYPIPDGVIIASLTNTTQQSIAFSWSASVNGGVPLATYYEAQLSFDNKTWGPACVSSVTSCTVNKLLDNTAYNVRIAVRNNRFDPIISPAIVLVTQTEGPVTCSLPCLNGGSCQSGYCLCLKGFDGPQCEFGGNSTTGQPNTPEMSKVEINPNNTAVSLLNKYVTLSFSMQSIAEVDPEGVLIDEIDLTTTQWQLVLNNETTVTHPTTQEQLTELLFGYVSAPDGLVSVNFTQYIPPKDSSAVLTADSYPVTFAGETINVKLGSLKYSVGVRGWQFNSTENSLYLSTLVGDIGNDTQVTFNNGSVMSTLVMVDSVGNQVYGRLINRVLVDNFPMRVSHLVKQSNQGSGTIVTTIIPSFIESFIYDPDISVLVYDKSETKSDPIDEKSWTAVIIGVTVGVVCAALIAGAVIFYLKKNKYQLKSIKRKFKRSISLKEWSKHR
ncbi:hypothetical protein DFA_10964 [Cavenderia fasciculata]|uniref:Fibronectin type III domain-containing protein n=1 Tax=Cavenderia fasciculata TaxID=261658 RepID=F4QBW8_CACFS|nr:uncharacterized protein DFA_10964 [Cavenderia fasciculata]EGG14706.1 hypothetical protein DFA_10964 [Cavenderia fasciculata]|eukprot:XP_004351214.1 hypothetical protein DFA_10964 [Cavenderia fasciculata]